MAPAESCKSKDLPCESSEHFTTNKKPLKISPKFTAVTIKLNTAPWKPGGTVNEETVFKILHRINSMESESYLFNQFPVKWELDSKCQLHCHTTVATKKILYRNKVLAKIKEDIPEAARYSIFLKPLAKAELEYWVAYCNKHKDDIRPLYYRIQQYYHNPKVIEDFSDLADYDIEYNTKTGHFQYIDNTKAKFDW